MSAERSEILADLALSRSELHPELGQGGPVLGSAAKQLYRALAQRGPLSQTAADVLVADFGGVKVLEELVRLRLIQKTSYGLVPIPRGQVIDDLLTEQSLLLRHALGEVLHRQQQIRAVIDAGDSLDSSHLEDVNALEIGDDELGLYEPPARARTELMALHPGGRFPADVLKNSLHRAEESLDSGVRLRVVHQASALAHPSALEYLQAIEERGGLVRVRQNLPFRMLIVDRSSAVCAGPDEGPDPGTFLVRGARMVTLLDRVFETTWVDSIPLQAMLSPDQSTPALAERVNDPETLSLERRFAKLTPQQQTILRCLAEGQTDQMIARRLGVNARTVSRRIAEVYEVLRVESRFQAGVAASRLGLV